MAMRSVGTLTLRHSLVSFHVKMYKPFDDAATGLKFNNLHKCSDSSFTKISLKNHCDICDVDVDYNDLVKGHEHAPGQFAIFTADEIKSCGDDTSVDLTIDKFVPLDSIPAQQFEGGFNFLAPETKGDFKSFATLQQAMDGVYGIGKVVTRGGHDRLVAIKAHGKLMTMHRLRPAVELRKIEDVPQYDAISVLVNPAELKLAKQLVKLSLGEFTTSEVVSERTDRLKDMLAAKVAGTDMPAVAARQVEAPTSDLMAALKLSLAALSA